MLRALINAYAPTLTNPEDVKDKFYMKILLILLGDFNGRVGRDSIAWKGIIGGSGLWNCNSNGLRLLELCSFHNLLITTQSFACSPERKHLRCILRPSTGIALITSLSEKGMSE